MIQRSIVFLGAILILSTLACTNDLEGHRERVFECDGIVVNIQYAQDVRIDCGIINANTIVSSFKILGEVGNVACISSETFLLQTIYFYDSRAEELKQVSYVLERESYEVMGNRVLSDVCIEFDKASYVELTLYLTSQPLLIDPEIKLSKVRIPKPYKI